jgi:hypothetical protein
MLLPHVVGRQVWKNQVETGNWKPSEVATTSDEALLLVAMDCYWNVWAAKAKHESENGNREYPRNMPFPIYINKNSQKSSWSNDGVTRFNELMEEVEQDRNSAKGKQFEIDFQSEMVGSSGNRGKKRKASSKMVQPRNDLSSDDDYDSRDEHEP